MRGTIQNTLIRCLFAICLFSFCGCSEDNPETPVTPLRGEAEEWSFEFLSDLAIDAQCILIDSPTEITASVRFATPADHVLDNVYLCRVDTLDAPIDTVAVLYDDGQTASGDLMEGDFVFTGLSEALLYEQPQTVYLKTVVALTDTLNQEDRVGWSSTVRIEVQGTEVVFTSQPDITPEGAFVYTTQTFRIITGLSVADSLDLQSIKVYSMTDNGDTLMVRGELYDNGNLDNADEIQEDGNFTGLMAPMTFYRPLIVRFRALATAVSPESGLIYRAWSTFMEVPVAYKLSQTSIFARIQAMQDSVEARYAADISAGLTPLAAKEAAIAWMQLSEEITEAFIAPDEASVWAIYNIGFEAGILFPDNTAGPILGHAPASRVDRSSLRTQRMDRGEYIAQPHYPWDRDMADPNEVHSNMALVLSPLHSWINDQAGESDPGSDIAAFFSDSHCPSFDVDFFPDTLATVEAFADLDRYGAVSIITHGTLTAGGQVCLVTGEVMNESTANKFYWDLTSADPRLVFLRVAGESYFAVKGSFFGVRNHNLPNSIITITACQAMRNNSLKLLLQNNGAGFVGGFDGAVGVAFGSDITVDFWRNLIVNGLTTGQAYYDLDNLTDPLHDDSEFLAFGNGSLQFGTDFQNGTFELGTLAAWRTAGDGRVISQLGVERPVDGNAMGIISTGLGYTTSTGEISQVVCVPSDATQLTFSYNFFSEEFLEWCSSAYQDYFEVIIIPEGGEEDQIFYIHIDDMCDDVLPTDILFDQGGSGDDPIGVYKSGWVERSLNISAYAGQTVTIRFAAGDIGDSIFDSAILLDSISID
ncbi:MAG: hypothetical protein GY835_10520 [bacterium]|nr:hypothetical protein [bacterium]